MTQKTAFPIIDLHSDLLSYLTDQPGRSPEDALSRSSYAQLMQGNVKLQTLAIFSLTKKGSTLKAKTQIDQFLTLPPTPISFLPAFENASCFAEEAEPLSQVIKRLEGHVKTLSKVFYISLTWDDENRFGGGNRTTIGLKEDGKQLLEWMSGKKIAIDLSHTSDPLAYDILDFTLQKGLNIPVLASHSNFRKISDYPRNLPEEIAKEIIARKGVIGLNFFAPFIHKTDPSALARHVEYALDLGAEHALCFGADFFCDADAPHLLHKYQRKEAYYTSLSNSACYPYALELFTQNLGLKEEQLLKIAIQNAHAFLTKNNICHF